MSEVKWETKGGGINSGGAQWEVKKVQNNSKRMRKSEEDGRKKKGGNWETVKGNARLSQSFMKNSWYLFQQLGRTSKNVLSMMVIATQWCSLMVTIICMRCQITLSTWVIPTSVTHNSHTAKTLKCTPHRIPNTEQSTQHTESTQTHCRNFPSF